VTAGLLPVKDWGWHRYVARYWRDEEHYNSGEPPLLEREFVESCPQRWLCYGPDDEPEGGWPFRLWGSCCRPGWVSWEVLLENVGGTLRFVSGGRLGGTRVVGAGWCAPPPAGWHARGPDS